MSDHRRGPEWCVSKSELRVPGISDFGCVGRAVKMGLMCRALDGIGRIANVVRCKPAKELNKGQRDSEKWVQQRMHCVGAKEQQ